jgi:hypothetical protein
MVEKAIVQYNTEEDSIVRNQIYNEYIKYALEKLAENIINTFKFPYITDKFTNKKADVVSHLILNLGKYDASRGKAYSYFGQAAKNYLIINNVGNYKKLKTDLSLDHESSHDDEHDVLEIEDHHVVGQNTKGDNQEFLKQVIVYLENNIDTMFKKQRELKIANAIIQLLQNYESIENFSKKNIYIMIRDMTNYKATHITRVLDKIRIVYSDLREQYLSTGYIETRQINSDKRVYLPLLILLITVMILL